MKQYLIYALIVCSISATYGQVGVNNPNPAVSSILDLTSFDKGFLMPRMTTQRRQTISSPAEALIVYDTDDAMFYFYDSTYTGIGNKKWTGISPFLLRDDNSFPQVVVGGKSDGGDTTINFKNIYTHETVRYVGIGTSVPLNPLSVVGSVSIGDASIIAPINGLYVKGNVEADTIKASVIEGYGTVPVGTVVMWTGSVAPDGWKICDGTSVLDAESPLNGTASPDLKGRFIVGIGKSTGGATTYNYKDNGGEETHVLSIPEIPSHNHGGSTSTNGEHDHDFTDDDPGSTSVDQACALSCSKSVGSTSGSSPDTTDKAGNHSHTISLQGGGGAHENRPPYYALAYIMRIK